ncbi:hypothetical protein PV703_30650, partial [Streptomyces sp. ME01-24h]|nr:hypothetical protein [Streptomyces sp. ME01-24h]
MPEVAEVVVLYALLTAAGAVAVALARSALRHWWQQRAGRAYELPVRRAGTVLRGSGSALAAAGRCRQGRYGRITRTRTVEDGSPPAPRIRSRPPPPG